MAGSLSPTEISAFLASRQTSGLFGGPQRRSRAPEALLNTAPLCLRPCWPFAPVLPMEQLMAGARVIPRARPATCPVLLYIRTKNPWCTDYYTDAAQRFRSGAAARWLAAAHRQPLYCPNDVVCTLRGGDARRRGGGGQAGGIWGREKGVVTYLRCSTAFLLIKTPICVFEVHNESVWLRGGTGRK